MPHIAALILDGHPRVRFAGLDVVERAALAASRAGAEHVHIVGDAPVDDAIVRRLRRRRLVVTSEQHPGRPFEHVPSADLLLVLPVFTIVEPAALRLLCRRSLEAEGAALTVDDRPDAEHRFAPVAGGFVTAAVGTSDAAGTGIVALPGDALRRVRGATTVSDALCQLAIADRLRTVTVAPFYCARLFDAAAVPRVEREYLRQTNGGDGEGFFTKNIRMFSIPVSRGLLRLPVTANVVTLMGFMVSVAAGLTFSAGTYVAGLGGALLYWASMVLDCSDGEVARATLGDSRFGAWLETITDYLSYFVVLGGIVWGDVRREGFCKHAVAAMVAAGTTLAIMAIVGYLRARIARANPGAFDDALAADLRQGTRVQQFTGWGRQLIKRSFLAHLILFQALIGQLPALTELWALGALAGLLLVLAVQRHVIRSVTIEPLSPTTTPSLTKPPS